MALITLNEAAKSAGGRAMNTQAAVVARDSRIMITRERLRDNNACPVGYAFFVRVCRKYARREFELQEMLDLLANATPSDDPEGLAYWYAHWLLATLGSYSDTVEVDSLEAPGHFFTAGNLVVRRNASIAGRLVAGGHVSIGGHLDAGHVQLAGSLDVRGDIRVRDRVEATSISAGGDLESSHSFIHADKGDVTAGGHILAAGEVCADVGTVRCLGDLVCGDGVHAQGQAIGGMLQVLNATIEANPELLLLPMFPNGIGFPLSLNRAARRKMKSKGKAKVHVSNPGSSIVKPCQTPDTFTWP